MSDGGNGLTSCLQVLGKNKLTMFGAHCPVNPLDQLAESKVFSYSIQSSTHGHCTGSGHSRIAYTPGQASTSVLVGCEGGKMSHSSQPATSRVALASSVS